ncbi:MAG: hypothetical protein Q9201_001635 [Fulgogasparrea decipioides]
MANQPLPAGQPVPPSKLHPLVYLYARDDATLAAARANLELSMEELPYDPTCNWSGTGWTKSPSGDFQYIIKAPPPEAENLSEGTPHIERAQEAAPKNGVIRSVKTPKRRATTENPLQTELAREKMALKNEEAAKAREERYKLLTQKREAAVSTKRKRDQSPEGGEAKVRQRISGGNRNQQLRLQSEGSPSEVWPLAPPAQKQQRVRNWLQNVEVKAIDGVQEKCMDLD